MSVPRTLVVLTLLVLGGAGLALIVTRGRSSRPQPPPGSVVTAGDFRMTLPRGWVRVRDRPLFPGFDAAQVAVLRGRRVRAAVAQTAPTHPSLVPRELVRWSGGLPSPVVVRAGTTRAYRYADLASGPGEHLDVFVVPTTVGTLTLACTGAALALALDECGEVLAHLHLARGRVLPLTADAAFRERLPAVVQRLSAQRRRARARLTGARTARASASAAADLAAAYAGAAGRLQPLVVPSGAGNSTVRTLTRLQHFHVRLAKALEARDEARFARTVRAIDGQETVLQRELARWQASLNASERRG